MVIAWKIGLTCNKVRDQWLVNWKTKHVGTWCTMYHTWSTCLKSWWHSARNDQIIYSKIDLLWNHHYSYLVLKGSLCLSLLCCRYKICGKMTTSSLKAKKWTVIRSHHEYAIDWNPSSKRLQWNIVENHMLLFTLSCNLIRQNIFTNILHAINKTKSIVLTHLFQYHCNAVTLRTDLKT